MTTSEGGTKGLETGDKPYYLAPGSSTKIYGCYMVCISNYFL